MTTIQQIEEAQKKLRNEIKERAVCETELVKAKHAARMIEITAWPLLKGTDTARRAEIMADDNLGEQYRTALNVVIGCECSLIHQAAWATIARDEMNVLLSRLKYEMATSEGETA